MRPKALSQFAGQQHLVGEQGILHTHLSQRILPSIIFWGPPGSGKTTLARLLAQALDKPFYFLSAVNAGVRDVRKLIDEARAHQIETPENAILFIDEIHRFAKNQQDALLGAVEEGVIILIGATTENPSFEIISPLLSRCQVYVLEPLHADELLSIAAYALKQDEVLSKYSIELSQTHALLRFSGGDARKLLNLLELVVMSQNPGKSKQAVVVTDELVQGQAQQKLSRYDKEGEQHYDLISALIKSIRGSDPNAAVYYLARMLEGGEPALFIARRLVILASEDVGNANPQALMLANSCLQAITVIGMPEGRILLSQAVTYLACSPKSNAAYMALNNAQALWQETGDLPVPLEIRNAPTRLMKELGYGANYKYAHHYEDAFAQMEFLPEAIAGTKLYDPKDNRWEQAARTFLRARWREKYGY